MKKLLALVILLISLQAAFSQGIPGYTYIAQRYEWYGGLFKALGTPAGDSPAFIAGQNMRAGALYYDSVGADSGLYVWSGLAWRLYEPYTDADARAAVQPIIDDTAAAIREDIPVMPNTLGSILNQTSFTDLTGYTNTGSSATIVSNAINFPTGASDYSEYLSYDYVTGLERFTGTIKVRVNEKSASSAGFGFGVSSVNSTGSYQSDMLAKFDMTNTANAGRLSLFSGGSTPTKLDSTSSLLSFSVGDSIYFTVDRDLNEITISAYNKTTNSATVTLSYNLINTAQPFNTGKFTVWPLGGDFTLYSIDIFSRQIKNANLMMVGDSKMGTYLLTDYYQRATAKMNNYFSSTIANSGNGDKTAEILQITHEIIALKPKYVFLYIGSNDVRTGVSSATYLANIDTITNRLTAAGINVVHGIFYETAISQATLLSHLQTNYSASYIDTYTPILECSGCLSDASHLSDAGHTKSALAIQTSGLVLPDYRLSMKDETVSSGLPKSIHEGGNSYGKNFQIGSNDNFNFAFRRNNTKILELLSNGVYLPSATTGFNPAPTVASGTLIQSAAYGGTTVLNIGVAHTDAAQGSGLRFAHFNVWGTNDFIQYTIPGGAYTRVGGYAGYLATNFAGLKFGTLNTDGQGATPIDFLINNVTKATLSNTHLNIVDSLKIGKAAIVSGTSDSAYIKDPVTGKVAYSKVGASGATPTLQQVTTAGNITTTSIISSSTFGFRLNADNGTTRARLAKTSGNGSAYLSLYNESSADWEGQLFSLPLSADRQWFLPNGNAIDTLATLQDVRDGGAGGGTWGSITGTLSDQTDLQSALDGKLAGTIADNQVAFGDGTSIAGSNGFAWTGNALTIEPGTNNTSALTINNASAQNVIKMSALPAALTAGTIWLGNITPSNTNYSLIADGTVTGLNHTTLLALRINGTEGARLNTSREFQIGSSTDLGAYILQVTGNTIANGNLTLGTAGNKLNITTGSNASIGVSAAMTAGTITISTTAVTANSIIILTHATLGGTQGILSVGTITAGTSFVINSSNAADTGTVNWWIVN